MVRKALGLMEMGPREAAQGELQGELPQSCSFLSTSHHYEHDVGGRQWRWRQRGDAIERRASKKRRQAATVSTRDKVRRQRKRHGMLYIDTQL